MLRESLTVFAVLGGLVQLEAFLFLVDPEERAATSSGSAFRDETCRWGT